MWSIFKKFVWAKSALLSGIIVTSILSITLALGSCSTIDKDDTVYRFVPETFIAIDSYSKRATGFRIDQKELLNYNAIRFPDEVDIIGHHDGISGFPGLVTADGNDIPTWQSNGFAYQHTISVTGEILPVDGISFGSNNWLRYVDTNKATIIADSAFAMCRALKYVRIPEVTKIGVGAFYGCDSLSTVAETSKCKWYAVFCFLNCMSLSNIDTSYAGITIYQGAFQGCIFLNTKA